MLFLRASGGRMRYVAEAVLALSTSPAGFTASDLAQKVHMSGRPESEYGARRAAYNTWIMHMFAIRSQLTGYLQRVINSM